MNGRLIRAIRGRRYLAYAAPLLAGLPMYLLLRRFGLVSRPTVWVAGAVIGAIVALLPAPSLRGDLFSIRFHWWAGALLGLLSAEAFVRLLGLVDPHAPRAAVRGGDALPDSRGTLVVALLPNEHLTRARRSPLPSGALRTHIGRPHPPLPSDVMARRLTRSNDRVIAGVCAGAGEFLGWSPTSVRALYVFLSIISAAFPGILVYLLLWWVMPEHDETGGFRLDDFRRQ